MNQKNKIKCKSSICYMTEKDISPLQKNKVIQELWLFLHVASIQAAVLKLLFIPIIFTQNMFQEI